MPNIPPRALLSVMRYARELHHILLQQHLAGECEVEPAAWQASVVAMQQLHRLEGQGLGAEVMVEAVLTLAKLHRCYQKTTEVPSLSHTLICKGSLT